MNRFMESTPGRSRSGPDDDPIVTLGRPAATGSPADASIVSLSPGWPQGRIVTILLRTLTFVQHEKRSMMLAGYARAELG